MGRRAYLGLWFEGAIYHGVRELVSLYFLSGVREKQTGHPACFLLFIQSVVSAHEMVTHMFKIRLSSLVNLPENTLLGTQRCSS